MNKFSDLNILPEVSNFTGDKIKISRILNREITVINFKIDKSKKKENSNYLTLQIELNGSKNVVFSGSTILMKMIKKVPKTKFPFTTTIVKANEYYEFT